MSRSTDDRTHPSAGDDDMSVNGFDPLSPDGLSNPFPSLLRAQEDTPVFLLEKYGLWCVTRYEDVRRVYADNTVFSVRGKHTPMRPPPEAQAVGIPADYVFPASGPQVNNVDAADHRRHRGILAKAMSPRLIRAMEPSFHRLAHELIDAFVDDHAVDLVPRFAVPFPTAVIGEMIGLPAEQSLEFNARANDYFAVWGGSMDDDERRACWERLRDLDVWLRGFIADRRAAPRDDIASALVHATDDGGLSEGELVANIFGLVLAASDTTVSMLTNTVFLMLSHDDLWSRARSDETVVPAAIEEALRVMGPVRASNRVVTEDVELGGVVLPAGSRLHVHHSTANRDPRVFDDAERFCPGRAMPKPHLAFGQGAHFCLGAPLARLEGRIALQALVERLPGLRLGDVPDPLPRSVNLFVPSVTSLPVVWDGPA